MAIEIDKEGMPVVGGIQAVREAFTKEADGKLACHQATMTYGEGNAQILRLVGVWTQDGAKTFDVTIAVPPGLSLAAHARQAARDLLDQ